MTRRTERPGPPALWLERLVWNAAAGAALAVMIAVLLGTLRVLDAVSAPPVEVVAVDAVPAAPGTTRPAEDRRGEVVASVAR